MNKKGITNGGPAFPVPAVDDPGREEVNPATAYSGMGGMSLRDYFAAAAMQALLSNPKLIDQIAKGGQGWIVESAWGWADDMLKERGE